MIFIKIYICFFILDAGLIALHIALGKRRRKASPAPGEDKVKEGEEILNQIFKSKKET